MSKSLLRKRFSVKERGSNEMLGKIEADFKMYPTRRFEAKEVQIYTAGAFSHFLKTA